MRRRRIAVVTGTRAEYGLLCSTLDALAKQPHLEVQLVVTGMHLLARFGRTISQIEKDGRTIAARIPMQRGRDDGLDQAEGLARGIRGMAAFFEHAKTDLVLLLGDRIEAMAAALAATTTGRVIAHIHGGDLAAGDFDDAIRHSLTKLAHLHFPATDEAASRILQMGEPRSRVHVVGAPGLDRLRQLLSNQQDRWPPLDRSGILICQHPCGRTPRVEQAVMVRLIAAAAETGEPIEVIYPNTDRGHSGILRAIEKARKSLPIQTHRSLPREAFLKRLLAVRVLLGNSSAGIIEAPFAGVASVNVGQRQRGRTVGGASVLACGESLAAIRKTLHRAIRLESNAARDTPYGSGRAGEQITKILVEQRDFANLRIKQFFPLKQPCPLSADFKRAR